MSTIYGFLLSFACAIHCLAMPFLVVLAPSFFANEWLEILFILFSLIITFYNLIKGIKIHKNYLLLLLFSFCILLLFFKYFGNPENHNAYGALSSISILMILVWNYKLSHKHCKTLSKE
jgi:O-antigen/teichoic acid export membrane protein